MCTKWLEKLLTEDQFQDQLHEHRSIQMQDSPQKQQFPKNRIHTNKYTIWNFIPKNLFEQFSKAANVYFAVIAALQCIREISNSDGKPVILVPLAFIILLTSVKDFIEDLKRQASDYEENMNPVWVRSEEGWSPSKWGDLRVGNIIKLKSKDFVPADIVLLRSSDKKGNVYIETKNLDGEANLKHKNVPLEFIDYFRDERSIYTKSAQFNYEPPNAYLYSFQGNAQIEQNEKTVPINANAFICRGCSIRDTEWIIGIVVYTGHHTKIMLNSVGARPKRSHLEKQMDQQILLVFIFQNVLCFVATFISAFWILIYRDEHSYLHYTGTHANFFYNLIVRFGSWLLLFTNFVPISLIVTLELVKFVQGIIISNDHQLFSHVSNQGTTVQTSSLNEELGQVHYIFSDKTGTLTCNQMKFKYLCVNGVSYGEKDVPIKEEKNQDQNKQNYVDFHDNRFEEIWKAHGAQNQEEYLHIKEAMLNLALCHTIIVEEKGNGETNYSAASPDELALINFAKQMGLTFAGVDESNNAILKINENEKETFRMLEILEFNSNRKRMSIIFENKEGDIELYCKGADSVIHARLDPNSSVNNPEVVNRTLNIVEDYAVKGMRTLFLSKKKLKKEEFVQWQKKYIEARASLENRDQKVEAVQDEIEQQLTLIGATAIEDKLQDEVPETIRKLRTAGIKIWMITGDKVETAINIAFSTELLSNDMTRLVIDGKSENEIAESINEAFIECLRDNNLALIVTGDALVNLTPRIVDKFMKLALHAVSVIACRASPKQKQELVTLVRKHTEHKGKVTLAIGDGANDVNMITAAHVGIGIKGVEGHQAARASDYSIGEFKILGRLLLFHGRECYRRNTNLILYNFYKNMLLVFPQFWSAFWSGFSGQFLYDIYLFQLFNIFFSTMPIMVYAILDKEFKGSYLMRFTRHYSLGMENKQFSMKIFWEWCILSIFQSLMIFVIAFYTMEFNFVDPDGTTEAFVVSGAMLFALVIFIVNFKIFLFAASISTFLVLTILLGLTLFDLSFFISSVFPKSELFDLLDKIIKVPHFYTGLVLALVVTHGFECAYWRYRLFTQNEIDVNRALISDDWGLPEMEKLKTHHSVTNYRGFAFSAEENEVTFLHGLADTHSVKDF